MTPPKVVIMLESLLRGGVQQGTLLLAPRLDKTRFDVEVWTLRRKNKRFWKMAPEFERAGVALRAWPVNGFHDNAGIVRLARALIEHRVALLNTRSFYPNILGRIAAHLARTPAVIANYHHTYEHRWKPGYIAQERLLRSGTHRFVCVSRAVENHLAPLLGLPAERTLTLHNGLDIRAHSGDEPRAETRRRLGLPGDVPIIANVGRLTEVKDLPTFFDGARRVLERVPASLFLVVGDGELRKETKREAAARGLGDSVRFMGARDDVPAILHASDLVVSTSLLEGFPRIVLEAFSARRPMITTPAGGVPEIVADGRNGVIIPFRDPAALADAVVRLLADPREAGRLAEAAWSDVQVFSLESWVSRTEEIFSDALRERSAGVAALDRRGAPSFPGIMAMLARLAAFRMRARIEAARIGKASL